MTHVEFETYHGFHVVIHWAKVSPGTRGGGTSPLGQLAPPLDPEESVSHHSPPGVQRGHYVMINVEKCNENHDFLMISEIIRDHHPRASRITLGHP